MLTYLEREGVIELRPYNKGESTMPHLPFIQFSRNNRNPSKLLFLVSGMLLFVLFPLSGQIDAISTHTISAPSFAHQTTRTTIDFPTVNPNYIYEQLFTMVTRYQHRQSGYSESGHDGFATYWAQEMTHDLQGFGPQVYKDTFPVSGWQKKSPTSDAFNVEVTVPGVTDPGQVVVIGCHYDGEASSTQSANDDASGCAIELGVAQAMGNYWRSHHVAPARTLRFVIFDAEEQGLYGSFHYLDSTVNGDVPNIVAMFNEEQNGIAYPLRYLGQASNPVLPLNIDLSPLQNNPLYPTQSKLPQSQLAHISAFQRLMHQAIAPVFAEFRALGYQELTYHGSDGQDHPQPLFTSEQTGSMHVQDDTVGGSDEIPFTLAGVPSATFLGNYSYYDRNPPAWSYPFDQPQDTIQLMNTFADGSSQQSYALTLAFAIPGMLTTWMLHQPSVLGEATVESKPIVTLSDIGQTQVGKEIPFQAIAAINVTQSGTTYSWNFDDGTTASGTHVFHTYKQTGAYQLTLTVRSTQGTRIVSKMLNIVNQSITYPNPYCCYTGSGVPPSNPQVKLPIANNNLKDEIISTTSGSTVTTVQSQTSQKTVLSLSSPLYLIAGIILLILAVATSISIILLLTRKSKT